VIRICLLRKKGVHALSITLTPEGIISAEEFFKKTQEEQNTILDWQSSPPGMKAAVVKDHPDYKGYLLGSLGEVSIAKPDRLPKFFESNFPRESYSALGTTVLSNVMVAIEFSLVSSWAKKASSLRNDQYYDAFADIALMVFDKKRHSDKDPKQGITREHNKNRDVLDLFNEIPSLVIFTEQAFSLGDILLVKVRKVSNGMKFSVQEGDVSEATLISDGKPKH
tara:strand:- start:44 stop:712 length:669 start_codon:yes stop_codon:yes gene_type:complete